MVIVTVLQDLKIAAVVPCRVVFMLNGLKDVIVIVMPFVDRIIVVLYKK